MMVFGFWLLAGLALGMILMAFLAIGTYQRGYDDGYRLRRPWRAELAARRGALVSALARGSAVAGWSREPAPAAVAAPPRAVASGG